MSLKVIEFNESFPPVMDGVANVTRNYAHYIKKAGGQTYVVTPAYPAYIDEQIFPVIRYVSVPIPFRHPYRMGFPGLAVDTKRKLESIKADIIHAHSPGSSAALGLSYAKENRIPCVATFHSKFYDDFKEVFKSSVLSSIMTDIVLEYFNRADYVWAVSEGTKQTLYDYGYQGEVDVVPNGADFEVSDNLESAVKDVNNKLKFKEDERVFLFVGQMIKQKNILSIIEALNIVKANNVPFKMIFVGEGKSKEEFEKEVKKSSYSKQAVFLGKILDREYLQAIFARADLFVFPSVYDNAPVVVREAAAVGTPSLVIRNSNAAEGIRHRENGYICDDSVESIADCIIEASRHPEEQISIGKNAQETVYRSWEDVINTIVIPKYENILSTYKKKEKPLYKFFKKMK